MAFLSGSFFPLDGSPQWLQVTSQLLPLRHLNDGMLDVMVRGDGPSAALAPDRDPARLRDGRDAGRRPAVPVGGRLTRRARPGTTHSNDTTGRYVTLGHDPHRVRRRAHPGRAGRARAPRRARAGREPDGAGPHPQHGRHRRRGGGAGVRRRACSATSRPTSTAGTSTSTRSPRTRGSRASRCSASRPSAWSARSPASPARACRRWCCRGTWTSYRPGDPDNWLGSNPFSAEIREGALFGRGACDMKAGTSANLAVARTLRDAGVRLERPLALHCVIGEEDGGLGGVRHAAPWPHRRDRGHHRADQRADPHRDGGRADLPHRGRRAAPRTARCARRA